MAQIKSMSCKYEDWSSGSKNPLYSQISIEDTYNPNTQVPVTGNPAASWLAKVPSQQAMGP